MSIGGYLEASGQFFFFKSFPSGSASKESTCNVGDLGSIVGLGRSPGEGNSYPLQYSGQENSMDCIVHGVAELDTTEWLSLYCLLIWLCLVLAVACGIFSCGMQDLVPWSGIEPRFPALGVQSLSLWATKEVPKLMNIYGGKKGRKPSLKKYTAIPSHWLIGALIWNTALQTLSHHRLFWRCPHAQKPTRINNNHLTLSEKDWRSWQRLETPGHSPTTTTSVQHKPLKVRSVYEFMPSGHKRES